MQIKQSGDNLTSIDFFFCLRSNFMAYSKWNILMKLIAFYCIFVILQMNIKLMV